MRTKRFNEITVEKINEAIKRHDKMSEDELKRFGHNAQKYFLVMDNRQYPVKRLIRLAYNKTENELKSIVTFNAIDAKNLLEKLGFEVIGVRTPRDKVSKATKFYATREGQRSEHTYLASGRNSKIVKIVKENAGYKCDICGFHFKNRIVEAHHLYPISQKEENSEVSTEDLIVLCPNCHALAHYLLGTDEKFTTRKYLIEELKKINNK